jgi:hypothetical protein
MRLLAMNSAERVHTPSAHAAVMAAPTCGEGLADVALHVTDTHFEPPLL